jgi:hypothetical protein
MTQQIIDVGSTANDGTGDPIRTAFEKTNDNFTELYNATTVSVTGNVTGGNINTPGVLSGTVQLVQHTADPGTTTNGTMYYNSNTNQVRVYINGAWHSLNYT